MKIHHYTVTKNSFTAINAPGTLAEVKIPLFHHRFDDDGQEKLIIQFIDLDDKKTYQYTLDKQQDGIFKGHLKRLDTNEDFPGFKLELALIFENGKNFTFMGPYDDLGNTSGEWTIEAEIEKVHDIE